MSDTIIQNNANSNSNGNGNDSQTIDLITLATNCIHATLLASKPIQELKTQSRTKHDGSLVTDADGAAQYIIYREIRALHSLLRIVGEESDLEMEANGHGDYGVYGVNGVNGVNGNDENGNGIGNGNGGEGDHDQQKQQGQAEDEEVVSPVSVVNHDTEQDSSSLLAKVQDIMQRHANSCNTSTNTSTTIDHERVSVFIDPLDGTSSYAKGYYEAVTILVAIIVDNIPVFGVIVKPFQEGTHLPCFEQTGSSVIYGGTLIQGAFVMGKYVPNSSAGVGSAGSVGSAGVGSRRSDSEFGNVVELERSRLWREHGSKLYQQQEQMISTTRTTATTDNGVLKNSNKAPRMVSYTEEDIGMANEEKEHIRILNDPHLKRYRKVSPRIVTGFPRSTSCPSSSSPILDKHKRSDSTSSIASSPNLPTIHTDANVNANAPTNHGNVQPPLLRAIISKSKGGGVVQNCIDSLSTKNLIHSQPLYITGAGYKTMKLVLGEENEGLWFFPKPGTSLWDVAAADALLRVMGGRISDKFGNDLDYRKGRLEADNLDGIIACCDERLHRTCLDLYNEEKWDE